MQLIRGLLHNAAAVAYLMDNPNGDLEMRSRAVLLGLKILS
jgi:hypothetical protein